jgi:hypothetical protein
MPCFVDQEVRIVVAQRDDVIAVRAELADGVAAMFATASD